MQTEPSNIASQVRHSVIKLKSLDQEIPDQLYVGEGDVSGRILTLVFTQEAAKQFTPEMEVYFSWKHNNLPNRRGYNILTKVNDSPQIWELYYPKSMLYEGTVTGRIELVDEYSIAPSRTFIINVSSNPQSDLLEDDLDFFQDTILDITNKISQAENNIKDLQNLYEETQTLLDEIKEFWESIEDSDVKTSLEQSLKALELAMQAIESLTWGDI